LIDADFSYTITNVYVGNVQAFNNYAVVTNSSAERGIDVGDMNDATVERCVAYNNGVHGNGGAGIHIYDSNNATVQRNESFSNHTRLTSGGSGFEINHRMSNSRIQYNYSHGNDGPGFWLLHENTFDPASYTNDVVRYNITENDGRQNGYASIDVMGRLDSVEVHNNTIFLNTTNPSPLAIRVQNTTENSLDVHGLHFRNNILQTTNSVRLVEVTPTQLDTATDLLFQGNAYYASGGTFDVTWNGTTYSSLDAWRTATSQEKMGATNTGTNINPRLSNPGNGSYKLSPNSLMIDHGLALSTLFSLTSGAVDFYSNSVPTAGGYDIGAYESPDPLPTGVIISNGFLNLKFARTRPPAAELTYAGDASSNLVNWCTSSCVTTQVVDNGDNTETVTIIDTIPISATSKRFLRVKITQLP
jgi:parallel beta-helix repeat protein